MKLSGYIQFPVNFCMGKFLISGLELKTGNWSFPEESTIVPCNIFLRFLFFRFELPTGNWNDDLALVHGQLYTTPKFHSNPSYSLWGEEGSNLKKTASKINIIMAWLCYFLTRVLRLGVVPVPYMIVFQQTIWLLSWSVDQRLRNRTIWYHLLYLLGHCWALHHDE